MNPMIYPERDLKGATPEKLARALLRPLRQRRYRPRPAGESVLRDQVAVEEPAADKPGDGVSHLRERV